MMDIPVLTVEEIRRMEEARPTAAIGITAYADGYVTKAKDRKDRKEN